MMPHHNQIETINDFLGGTVIGAILQIIIGIMTFLAVNIEHIDKGLTLLVKLGSLGVVIFGIVNGYMAYKKNKKELHEQQRPDKP